jgi:hypothetical protein
MRLAVWSQPLVAGLSAGLLMLALPGAQATCLPLPKGAQVLKDGDLQVAWLPDPAPIRVGQSFALRVIVCPADAELSRVDAHMPEHRHGMNYRPSVKHLGQGLWRAEGLLWHMSGRWQLRLDVRHQGQELRLLQSVELP